MTKSINENLATIPPLRINTFTCNGLKTLVLSIHHTLYDGTSLPVLLQDVERQYFGLERVPTASLATILSEIAKQDLGSAQKFWVDTFRDFVWPKPYFDKPSSELSEPAKYLSVPFDLKLSQVKEIANKKQVTLQAFLSFIFAYLAGLHLYRTDDVPFGVSNRYLDYWGFVLTRLRLYARDVCSLSRTSIMPPARPSLFCLCESSSEMLIRR